MFDSPSTPFVGREREIDTLVDLVIQRRVRLLTIIGEGGIGKTRLSLEVADRARDHFADGVMVVPLEAVSTPAQVELGIADSLGIPQSNGETTESLIFHYLRERHLLLLLDNYEHLLPDITFIGGLLNEAPHVQVLVTSREILNLRDEWVFAIDGLPIPQSEIAPADLDQFSALRLFASLYQRQRYQQNLTPKDIQAMVRICRAVQGMPLALELAASWSRLLSLDEIARELAQGIDLLATNLRDFPARHRSMRAVFDQSWAHLSPTERDAFMRLAIFRGGFRREAALSVAQITLDTLASLAEKSLIRPSADGRYHIHELLRQYGEDMLAQHSDLAEAARRSHEVYFLSFLNHHDSMLIGADQHAAIVAIDAEDDNIRSAWQYALDHADAAHIGSAANALATFLDYRGRYQEVIDYHEAARSMLLTADDPHARPALANVLATLGWGYFRVGRISEVRACLEQSVQLYEESATIPPDMLAHPRPGLALLAVLEGSFESALALGEESLRLARAHGQRANETVALYVIASALLAMGRYEDAYRAASGAASVARTSGNRWFLAYCLNQLGQSLTARGDYAAAQRFFEESYAIRDEFADPEGSALALCWIGRILHLRGDLDASKQSLERSIRLYRDIGDRGGLVNALTSLADTTSAGGDHALAQVTFQEALTIALESGFVTHTLALFASVGVWLVGRGGLHQGGALLEFVANHPGTEQDIRARARQDLATHKPARSDSLLTWDQALSLAQDAVSHAAEQISADSLAALLSDREREILRLIAAGMSNQAIAEQLILAIGTVKAHAAHIFNKLGVDNRLQAIRRAQELGLL